jgi:hypothetical protein
VRGTLRHRTRAGSTPINQADSHLTSTTLCVSHQLAAKERHAPGDELDSPSGALALLCPSDPCLLKSHFVERLFVKGAHTVEREGCKTKTTLTLHIVILPELLFTATTLLTLGTLSLRHTHK